MIKYEVFIEEDDLRMIEELSACGVSISIIFRNAIFSNYTYRRRELMDRLEIVKEQYE
nr:MAG TPA: hypothetical protein [Caudoviricetes sp.]DAU40106.1 MAG TPA: hypothetical protein [Caudoviricetes sp.]